MLKSGCKIGLFKDAEAGREICPKAAWRMCRLMTCTWTPWWHQLLQQLVSKHSWHSAPVSDEMLAQKSD